VKVDLFQLEPIRGKDAFAMNKKLVLAATLCLLSLVAATNEAFAMPSFAEAPKRAVFLSPLEDWYPTWNLNEYVSTIEQAGYQVDVFLGENVSIAFLKTGLSDYDVIIFRTDSFTSEGVNYYCSGEPPTTAARKEYAVEASNQEIEVGACVGFSHVFIRNHYPEGSLRKGLVFVIDGYSADLSFAFLKAGAAAYMGYYDARPLRFGCMDALSIKWLKFLGQGYTVKEAMLELYLYLSRGHGRDATWPSMFLEGDYGLRI
jgi:hypothetical protein